LQGIAGIRKSLTEENNQQTQRNTQAEKVISIMHEISGRNVQTAMDFIATPFGVNSQEAILEIMRTARNGLVG
jgi:NifB/MoaA-like Fe-S oxidoreductase